MRKISIPPGNSSAREASRLRDLRKRPLPLQGELQLQQCRPYIEQKPAPLLPRPMPSQGQSPSPHSQRKKRIVMKWKSVENKITSALKSWAVRMPSNTMVWGKKQPQCREVSCWKQTSLYALCYLEQRAMKEAKKAAHHFAVLGIMSVPTGTQSKSTNIYSVPTMCQVLGKVVGLDCWWRQTILALQILDSNKEDQWMIK